MNVSIFDVAASCKVIGFQAAQQATVHNCFNSQLPEAKDPCGPKYYQDSLRDNFLTNSSEHQYKFCSEYFNYMPFLSVGILQMKTMRGFHSSAVMIISFN